MKKVLLSLLVIVLVAAIVVRFRYGGGDDYRNLTGQPLFEAAALEVVLGYSEPLGNVAVNATGRIFFTVHPEAKSAGNKLLEYVNGASVPYPSLRQQDELFDKPLGIAIDRFDRLWVIDHRNHGLNGARIVAIELATGEVLRQQDLDATIAPAGSMLQDLQISADGQTIVIADTSIVGKKPALIVYDVATGDARRVLENHASVQEENYVIRTPDRSLEYFGGLIAIKGGVDGIALGPEWLYFGALTGSALYRVRLADLTNSRLSADELANRVARFGDKPLSDGLSVDLDGNVYITDIEHNAILLSDGKSLKTLVRSRRIRWPDALSFGPDGYLYIADSALPEVILQSSAHIGANKPYRIFRFKPGHVGTPGQ